MPTPDRTRVPAARSGVELTTQYFEGVVVPPLGGVVEPPLALHELFLVGSVAPPEALQLALPPLVPAPAAFGSGVAVLPPPQPTIVPISIPAIAETARAFPMFI